MRKPLDNAKPGRLPQPANPKAGEQKGRGAGRPLAITDEELVQRRDSLFGIFTATWQKFAWELGRAKSLRELIEALKPLARSGNPQLAFLLHRPSGEKRSVSFSKLRKEVEQAADRFSNDTKVFAAQGKRLKEAREAFKELGRKRRQAKKRMEKVELVTLQKRLLRELLHRREELRGASRAWRESEIRLAGFESSLRDQEAIFAQTEILSFLHSRRYELMPHTLANALAGLPWIGWRRSYVRCEQLPCDVVGSRHYDVFVFVQRTLEKGQPRSPAQAIENFESSLTAVPAKPESLEEFLRENARYMRIAIAAEWKTAESTSALPFRITAGFFQEWERPRSPAECVLKELEQL